jgi:hypothetical protein
VLKSSFRNSTVSVSLPADVDVIVQSLNSGEPDVVWPLPNGLSREDLRPSSHSMTSSDRHGS